VHTLTLDEEHTALWEIFEAYEGVVVSAVDRARDSIQMDVSFESLKGAAAVVWPVAVAKSIRRCDGNRHPMSLIWMDLIRSLQNWAATHVEAAAGSEFHTRIIRRHADEVEGLPAKKAARRLQDEYTSLQDLTVQTTARRLRSVRSESEHLSLHERASTGEDAQMRVVDVLARKESSIEPERLGELLAERTGNEALWDRLMTANRDDELTPEETRTVRDASTHGEAAAKVCVSEERASEIRSEAACDAA